MFGNDSVLLKSVVSGWKKLSDEAKLAQVQDRARGVVMKMFAGQHANIMLRGIVVEWKKACDSAKAERKEEETKAKIREMAFKSFAGQNRTVLLRGVLNEWKGCVDSAKAEKTKEQEKRRRSVEQDKLRGMAFKAFAENDNVILMSAFTAWKRTADKGRLVRVEEAAKEAQKKKFLKMFVGQSEGVLLRATFSEWRKQASAIFLHMKPPFATRETPE
jgi:hypothetical protein